MALEEEFDTEIPDEEAEKITTVQQLSITQPASVIIFPGGHLDRLCFLTHLSSS